MNHGAVNNMTDKSTSSNLTISRIIPRLVCIIAFAVLAPALSHASLDILVIGSSKSFSDGKVDPAENDAVKEKAFDPSAIATQLSSILSNDSAFSNGVNVVFEDIYRYKQMDTAMGGGGDVEGGASGRPHRRSRLHREIVGRRHTSSGAARGWKVGSLSPYRRHTCPLRLSARGHRTRNRELNPTSKRPVLLFQRLTRHCSSVKLGSLSAWCS